MIISQDDNLKTELPKHVYNLLELHLKNIQDIDSISLNDVFGFEVQSLEDLLKHKLRSADGNTLVEKLHHIRDTEQTFLDNLISLLGRLFMIHQQEELLHDKIIALPEEFQKFLQQEISNEREKIQKNISDLKAGGQLGDGGPSVHPVYKYEDQQSNQLFFVKDAEDKFLATQYTGIKSEAAREVAGSAFYHSMGFTDAAKVYKTDNKIVSESVAKPNETAQTLDVFMQDQKANNKDYELDNDLLKQLMEAHAVAMLVGNRDAKDGNIMVVTDEDGKHRIAPIDFGLSFHDFAALNNAGAAGNKLSSAIGSGVASAGKMFGGFKLDTDTMRHIDSEDYFNQEKFRAVLQKTLKDFEKNKNEIFKKMYLTCEALELTKEETKTMIQTIKNNADTAKQISEGKKVKPKSFKNPQPLTRD